MTWPTEATALLQDLRAQKLPLETIAERFQAAGYPYSPSAIARKLQRLRRKGATMKTDFWPADAVSFIVRAWAEGHTASDIARWLNQQGLKPGVSRNAVIGKLMRMKLQRRTPAQPVHYKHRQPKLPSKPKLPVLLPRQRAASVAKSDRIAINAMRPLLSADITDLHGNACKYAIGDLRDGGGFCGRERGEHFAYCPAHRELCYAPSEPKSRKRAA